MQSTLDLFSGKTCLAFSAPATTPSDASWERWRVTMPHSFRAEGSDGPTRVWLMDPREGLRGAFSMLNISAWPNGANVCSLSQVLETGPIPQKYYLSAKACRGILRRAEKRGKELPPQLKLALTQAARGGEPTSCAAAD